MMKIKIDLNAILTPIPGKKKTGENLRYDNIYDELKEARREEDELNQGDWVSTAIYTSNQENACFSRIECQVNSNIFSLNSYESFIKAGELSIISADLAEELAPSAGLRNRLVHEYDLLDHSLVLEAVKMAEELYPGYIKEIETFIAGGV